MNAAELEERLLNTAIERRATDIHIEPRGEQWEIRMRTCGVLMHDSYLSTQEALSLLQRIKVKGNMDISEKRLPQDGGYTYADSLANLYDLRLSSLPTIEGEKLAIRILYRDPEFRQIEHLGLEPKDYEQIINWINDPMGLILVTGPTGSGKTTTLYAILQYFNNGLYNICTIEDPVEIRIKGLNQVQVNETAGLTFSKGLRSLLRQDPDIIMIGEIRDLETAEIAIRASLSGHLVLATLHANDAASSITRLLEMGIEPYLVGTAVKGVVAQRMITHLCPKCAGERECTLCEGKRVLKRSPRFELLQVREEMIPLILKKSPASELRALSRQLELQLTMQL
jgi:type II secretory ATPase GspE/PulE/Tfp pilus assembly ATPase PilB-like protein